MLIPGLDPRAATLVIINPAAGRGKGDRIWRRVESSLRARLGEIIVRRTERAGDAERIARNEAAALGLIVVVGGDGSVHEAVNGLLDREPAPSLAVIPAGTGNDFAANCGIPLDPRSAILVLDRPARRVDLGRMSFGEPGGAARSRWFLNSASVGVSARANRVAQLLRRVLPGRLCYWLGGLLALLLERRRRFTVHCADRVILDGPALNLTVANGAGFGGGMQVSPDSTPFDGRLDLVTIGPLGRLRALVALARLYRGGHLALRHVTVTPCQGRLRIFADGKMGLEADGQDFETDGTLDVEVLPGKLSLLC